MASLQGFSSNERILNDFYSKPPEQIEGKKPTFCLVVENNQLSIKKGAGKTDIKKVAKLCAQQGISHEHLEEAVSSHNARHFLFGKIPKSVQLELQLTKMKSYVSSDTRELFFITHKARTYAQPEIAFNLAKNAAEHNCDQVLKMLLKHNTFTQEQKNELLCKACATGSIAAARTLLDAKASIIATDPKGWFPLMYATDSGDRAMCEFLLKHGAKADQDHQGFTPLMLACQKNRLDAASTLIQHGANRLAQNGQEKMSPLMWASQAGNVEIVKLLLTKEAAKQRNLQNSQGKTAFQLSEAHPAVRTLIMSGK